MTKVKKILIRTSGYDGKGRAPYGYFHILKCYNDEQHDFWPLAYISIDEKEAVQKLVDHFCEKYNVESKWE